MPASVEFYNNEASGETIEDRLENYERSAQAAGLEYPVLCKLQTGQRSTYAHTFFCVNNQTGLREAFSFEGFQNVNLLIQAYLPHKERVYKVYGLGTWF